MSYWRLPLDWQKHEVVIGQVNIIDLTGERLTSMRSTHSGASLELPAGEGVIECRVDDLRLVSGEYLLMLDIGRNRGASEWLDCVPEALQFHLRLGNYLGGAELVRGQGRFAQRSQWSWRPGRGGGQHAG